MAQFCLIPEQADKFLAGLKDGTIDYEKMSSMTSKERHDFLSGLVGEDNAKGVNSLFESKMLLKPGSQKYVMVTWAKQVAGLKPAVRRDMIAKIERLDRVLNPEEADAFLHDLAETRLGLDLDAEEAVKISDMTKKIGDLSKNFDEAAGTWTSEKDRLEYGMARADLEDFTDNLKGADKTLKEQIIDRKDEFKADWGNDKIKAVSKLGKDTVNTISDTMVASLASIDNSFLGRQGLKTLMTHPTVWAKAAKESFKDIAKTFGDDNAKKLLMADIYSRPNFMNRDYITAKLMPEVEEQFPTTLPERIPFLGKFFKASEVAFEGSGIRMRTDLYDMIAGKARENGVLMNKAQVEDLGTMINALTAKGKMDYKTGHTLRIFLWAPKMLKGNWDVLTAHTLGTGLKTKTARIEAVKNITKIAAETATIMMAANALVPGSAEYDPRSADFGKIKIGNTRFDITGGAASIVTLASRIATLSTKSTTNGQITKLNTGEYNGKTVMDVIYDFLEGKAAPFPKLAIDIWGRGETFKGEKPTVANEFPWPISIKNVAEAYTEKDFSPERIAGLISDLFGISSNTYAPEGGWSKSSSQDLKKFKETVGDKKFGEASDRYDKELGQKIDQLKKDDRYKNASPEAQQKIMTKVKDGVKDDIFDIYNFKFKAEKKPKDTGTEALLKSLGF